MRSHDTAHTTPVGTGRAAPAGAAAGRPPRDVRGFWRVLLAIIAPLPMLAKAIYYVLSPVDGGAEFSDTLAAYAGHEELLPVLTWLDAVFVTLLIPATFAVAWVARRGAPRLATVAALISLVGFFAGVGLLGGVIGIESLTVRHSLDVEAMAGLSDVYANEPIILVAGLLFIVGIVFGLGLLGIALWRSRVAPAWLGIALAAGGFTHPFIPGHVAQGVGLAVAAVGFAGASVALLRMRNDDFDLPATGAR
jgi:hypothetical protein